MADQPDIRTILKNTFDTVADGYDKPALRFFPASANHLAGFLGLTGDERVLDVACGTGHATCALAHLLPHGSVTAVDFSPGMLRHAREKAAARGLGNIEFLERDMQTLGFKEQFDAAVCAFGIFFVEDMAAQLAHISSTVRSGGRIAITNFRENYFQPMRDLLFDRLATYGITSPPQAWKLIANEAGCRQLFEKAGLVDIRIETKNVGYDLEDAGQWWDIVWNAGYRRMVARLAPHDQERFKAGHLKEVAALASSSGIRLDVEVLFTVGTKP